MFDVITIGSASYDVFLKPHEARIVKGKEYEAGEGVCFSLGAKIDVPELHFSTGGSATNSAITFSRQGFRSAALSKIGSDTSGEAILKCLKEQGVSEELVILDKKYFTAYSVILTVKGQRTIFVHRGATEHLCCDEPIPYEKLKDAKWFYITNLGGESEKIFVPLIEFAVSNNIKIALNPGKAQLKLGKKLAPILSKIDVLILNQEEASYLTGVAFADKEGIFKILDSWVKGVSIMTRGRTGFVACDNQYMYIGGILKEPKYVDRTGAGDAFGSACVAGIMKGMALGDAFQLASANATSVLSKWGANEGLLSQDDDIYKFGKLEIIKKPCHE
ncbi:MAG: carbohydrate kinase family protein [Candidatus Spechtbacteria bacterium]|nr:carbohydrate kinase family protein [Candidatus Spechtbacteria bacterium]